MTVPKLLVDVHTHVYLPRYASVLRSRNLAPRILTRPSGEERLLILENEPSGGRPVGAQVLDSVWIRRGADRSTAAVLGQG
jgi:aminocarboxymuconate-semialdehyde decarboxylase